MLYTGNSLILYLLSNQLITIDVSQFIYRLPQFTVYAKIIYLLMVRIYIPNIYVYRNKQTVFPINVNIWLSITWRYLISISRTICNFCHLFVSHVSAFPINGFCLSIISHIIFAKQQRNILHSIRQCYIIYKHIVYSIYRIVHA